MLQRSKNIINRLLNRQVRLDKAKELTKIAEQVRLTPIGHYQPEDIFIAGYPKSGNTWMQTIMASLLFGLDVRQVPVRLMSDLVPEVYDEFYRRYLTPTYFKTHDLPDPLYRRVIHLVRDGRDAMASYYHYLQARGYSPTWDDLVANGGFRGLWHDHTEQWLDNPYDADIILVKYEDLLSQPLVELQRICDFGKLDKTDDALQKVIEQTSFSNMRSSENKFGIGHQDFSDEHNFVRKGKVGSYKEDIPAAVIPLLNAQMKDTLNKLGYTL